ncbi:DUF6644 family protein [Neorhizobium sp. DT-125]|uniref:DUF6644 family protein n=1 Tax=Neorhizobium sp. DT-125 TaxID=3396163 RepID=UPI003F1B8200
MQLDVFFGWIETLHPVRLIVMTPGIYPAISAIHIAGIAILVGSIVPADLRLLRVIGPQLDAALPTLVRAALIGFAVAAASGLLLASVRIGNYAQNPAFLFKMSVLLMAGVNAVMLRIFGRSKRIVDLVGGRLGRAAAAVSISLWIAAIFAGRWIAFV